MKARLVKTMNKRQLVLEVEGEVVEDAKGGTVAVIEGRELTLEEERAVLDGADVTVEE